MPTSHSSMAMTDKFRSLHCKNYHMKDRRSSTLSLTSTKENSIPQHQMCHSLHSAFAAADSITTSFGLGCSVCWNLHRKIGPISVSLCCNSVIDSPAETDASSRPLGVLSGGLEPTVTAPQTSSSLDSPLETLSSTKSRRESASAF